MKSETEPGTCSQRNLQPYAYRRDIDGLRAVAVLAVLLFHAGFSHFQGGYVGVDVFFVISGYLITNIIIRDLETETFSLLNFYERRVRRIIPALTVTIVIALAGGAALFAPGDFENLGQSVTAVSLFSSNILFWIESGYFDASAELKPLLHTWSLGVEEQFYIAFPLLLAGIRRFLGARFVACLSVLAVVSFGLSVLGTRYAPTATFYLAPTRAWELMAGALIACGVLPALGFGFRDFLAAVGLSFIVASIVLYGPDTPFPGVAALLPAVGAAFIIYAGTGGATLIGRLLSVRPLVFVGVISYSLYLLHWPLLVFAKQFAILELSTAQTLVLLALTFGLSALSWAAVERPFRTKRGGDRHQVFVLAGSALAVSVGIGLIVDITDGVPGRSPVFALTSDLSGDAEWTRTNACSGRLTTTTPGRCGLGSADATPSFLLWGDSHAQALTPAVSLAASSRHVSGVAAFLGGCPPLLGVQRADFSGPACGEFVNAVLDYVDRQPQIETIILAGRWALSATERRYKREDGPPVVLLDVTHEGGAVVGNAGLLTLGLNRTVSALLAKGRNVVLVDEIPEVGYDVPSAYGIAYRTGRDVNRIIAPSRQEYEVRNLAVRATFSRLSLLPRVHIVSVSQEMCDALTCRVIDPVSGRSLYRDSHHLSTFGAQRLSRLFDGVFERRTLLPIKSDTPSAPLKSNAGTGSGSGHSDAP